MIRALLLCRLCRKPGPIARIARRLRRLLRPPSRPVLIRSVRGMARPARANAIRTL